MIDRKSMGQAVALLALILLLPQCRQNPNATAGPPEPLVLTRVLIPVTDIDDAVRFYRSLLSKPGEWVSTGRHDFAVGTVLLSIVDPSREADSTSSSDGQNSNDQSSRLNVSLELRVLDLEVYRGRAMKAGANMEVDIDVDVTNGESFFVVFDPFGNQIRFVSFGTPPKNELPKTGH